MYYVIIKKILSQKEIVGKVLNELWSKIYLLKFLNEFFIIKSKVQRFKIIFIPHPCNLKDNQEKIRKVYYWLEMIVLITFTLILYPIYRNIQKF